MATHTREWCKHINKAMTIISGKKKAFHYKKLRTSGTPRSSLPPSVHWYFKKIISSEVKLQEKRRRRKKKLIIMKMFNNFCHSFWKVKHNPESLKFQEIKALSCNHFPDILIFWMDPYMYQSKCRVWFPHKEKINYFLSKQCEECDSSSCGTSSYLLCVWLFNTPLLAICTCATRSSLNLSTYWCVISWKSHLLRHEI